MNRYLGKITESIKQNFAYATLNFIFIIIYVNVFQKVFGRENSIVGVIFTILMSASMLRDMTAAPVKHLFIQSAVLVSMGIFASLVSSLAPIAAFPINLIAVFVILYCFTYEYSSHMYFPYILSYLFMVFISPVSPQHLPMRLLGLFVGAVSIIVYQLVKGRRRVVETAQDVLSAMADEAVESIYFLLTGKGKQTEESEVRHTLTKLIQIVYERRKRVLHISDASFSMIDAGRGLEHIILLLQDIDAPVTARKRELLQKCAQYLEQFRAYVRQETEEIPEIGKSDLTADETNCVEMDFYHALVYIREHLLHMSDPQKRMHYRRTMLSISVRLKAALDISPVRVIYAGRVAILIAVVTLLVQEMNLTYGKWIMFTIASLSMPYADDVGKKMRKRILATILGGLIAVAAYALIPSMLGRTVVMMLSGYLSFYFADYLGTFACSTIGALGGAVLMNTFGFSEVGQVFLIRIGLICVGAVIAVLANCVLFPYKRETATRHLLKKYIETTRLLSEVCTAEEVDTQLYYYLVIEAHLQEEKLMQNREESDSEMEDILEQCRRKVRRAHRHHITGINFVYSKAEA
jgi:uncharacterized membrane protein YccC